MTDATKAELLHAIRLVEDYVGHRKSCSYGTGMGQPDHCTCGVGDVIAEVDDILSTDDSDDEYDDIPVLEPLSGRDLDVGDEVLSPTSMLRASEDSDGHSFTGIKVEVVETDIDVDNWQGGQVR